MRGLQFWWLTQWLTEWLTGQQLEMHPHLKINLPQDKERLKEQCVEKGYYNAKFKMKMTCKYIETSGSGGRLKNLEITTEPKGAVWAGVMDLNSGKCSFKLSIKNNKCCFSRGGWSEKQHKKGSKTCSQLSWRRQLWHLWWLWYLFTGAGNSHFWNKLGLCS